MKNKWPWPAEKPAWTAGAILLAADSVYHATPAHELFVKGLPETEELVADANAR